MGRSAFPKEATTQVRMSQSNGIALKKIAEAQRRSLNDQLDIIFVAGLRAMKLESVLADDKPRSK